MRFTADCKEVLVTEAKFLAFMRVRPDMTRLRWHFLALGLGASWLAGMGRYWDTPEAQWWQYAGFGSVVYTLFMAAFLWALVMPMHPANWSYLNVLIFVGMTAPPAIFYAIPVERMTDLTTASQVNYLFLLLIAIWRVALLWTYLRRAARLGRVAAFFALALPLALILLVLAWLQISETISEGMAGNRAGQNPPNIAGQIVEFLGGASFYSLPVLVVGYMIVAAKRDKGAATGPVELASDATPASVDE